MKTRLWMCAAIAVALLAQNAVSAAADLRIGVITPPPHEWSKTATRVAEEIKAKSGGKINLLVFPSGQLGNEAQMLQQLQSGVLDFAFLTLGEFANRDPNYGALLAPYLVKNVAGARALLKGPAAQELLGGVSKFGLVGLGYGMAGMRQILTAGEVKAVGDLSGKKIRTIPLAPELDFWRMLGSAPTPMPLPAVYDAFANRQIDGMQIDFEGTWNTKYYTNAATMIASNHMMFPMIAVASARKWAKFSKEEADLIASVMKAQIDQLVASYARIDADYLAKIRTTKVSIVEAARPFFGPAIDTWYSEWRNKAPILKKLEQEAAKL